MSTKVAWLNTNRTAILIKFYAPWTWEDFYSALTVVDNLLDLSLNNVDVLLDFTDGCVMPGGAIGHLRRAITSRHQNRGRIFLIGAKQYTRAFERMMTLPQYCDDSSLILAETIEQAKQIINHDVDLQEIASV